jgi:WD40 repeat protein
MRSDTGPVAEPLPAFAAGQSAAELRFAGQISWIWKVAVSPDGRLAATGSMEGTVTVWDLRSGRCRSTLPGHRGDARDLAFTVDGKQLVSGSHDGSVRVWSIDQEQGRAPCTYRLGQPVYSVATLSDGLALICCHDGTLLLLDTDTGKVVRKLIGHRQAPVTVAISSVGRCAVSGSHDTTIKLWSLVDGRCLRTLHGHADVVRAVSITAAGKRAVSGSDDRTVKLWNLDSGACLGTLEGHLDRVDSVAISPDGTHAASAGMLDQTVRVWDLQTGRSRIIRGAPPFFPTSVAFSPDGRRLVAGGAFATGVFVHDLEHCSGDSISDEVSDRVTSAKVVAIGSPGGRMILPGSTAAEGSDDSSDEGRWLTRIRLAERRRSRPLRLIQLLDLTRIDPSPDLAGLLLGGTVLAVVLIDLHDTGQAGTTIPWLDLLPRDIPRLVVGVRFAEGGGASPRMLRAQLEQELGWAEYVEVVARPEHQEANNKLMLRHMWRHIRRSVLPWTSTPDWLQSLKESILDLAAHSDSRLVSPDDIADRLLQLSPDREVTPLQIEAAVKYLANQGLVLPIGFGDLVLLRPGDLLATEPSETYSSFTLKSDASDSAGRTDGRLTPAQEALLLRAAHPVICECSDDVDDSTAVKEARPFWRRLMTGPSRRSTFFDQPLRHRISPAALRQKLLGHIAAACIESHQRLRRYADTNGSLHGEIELIRPDGRTSTGHKIYIHVCDQSLEICMSESTAYTRVAAVKDDIESWAALHHDVYLVILSPAGEVLWMNATRAAAEYPSAGSPATFKGEKVDAAALWRLRDAYLLSRDDLISPRDIELLDVRMTQRLTIDLRTTFPATYLLSNPARLEWQLRLRAGEISRSQTLSPEQVQTVGFKGIRIQADTGSGVTGRHDIELALSLYEREQWRLPPLMISNARIDNPFIAGPPIIDDKERFFGREMIIESIRRKLRHSSVVITATWRSGKTSLLHRLRDLLTDWVVVFVDMQEYAGTASTREMVSGLGKKILRAAGLDTGLASSLGTLNDLSEHLHNRGVEALLILLDEIGILCEQIEIGFQIRAMSKQKSPRIRVIATGTEGCLERIIERAAATGSSSDPFNEFDKETLRNLSLEDSEKMLRKPIEGYCVYHEAALQRLLTLGAGRPFFLNKLAQLAFKAMSDEEGRMIRQCHVDEATRMAPRALGTWYKAYYSELDRETRLALGSLIRSKDQALPDHYRSRLQRVGLTIGWEPDLKLDPMFIDWLAMEGRGAES